MAEGVINLTDVDFEKEILKSDLPVMVDFWASWCMPCKMIAPTVKELAKDYKGKLKVAKIDIDDNSQIATNMNVMNIPTVIFFKNGKEYKRMIGVNPKRSFIDIIKELLGE